MQSDHKPLEAILQKPLHNASPRLQLMGLRLLRYQLTVYYVPGSKMYIADALSKARWPQGGLTDPDTRRIHSVVQTLPASPQNVRDIQSATNKEELLCKLRDYTYKANIQELCARLLVPILAIAG